MELVGLKLKNFRGYRDIEFDLSQNLHMIVGNNDIGKSTILEALDIFFNDKSAVNKISFDDLNHKSKLEGETTANITCLFKLKEDEQVVIDSSFLINPKDEFLLNELGLLEITKKYDFSGSTIKQSIYIVSCIPNCIDSSILTKKQTELKTLVERLIPDSDVDKRVNSLMRQALYQHYLSVNPEYTLETKEIDTKSILNDKDFYTNLEKQLPDFYLFKADRENNTADSEIQNPLSLAVKDVLQSDEVKQKLNEIQELVTNHINEVNVATIEQMKRFSNRLGNSLKANLTTNWSKAFSNDINDSNDIPINKKGSGIRRLLLLSYLMVDANKKSFIKNKKNIIYAIEEPETALHPNLQVKFISELYSMANKHNFQLGNEIPTNLNELTKYKILLTTHTPNYLAFSTQEEVIYLSENENGEIIELSGETEYDRIKNEMGLLPNPNYGFVIFVEGDSDVQFLKNIGKIEELKNIFNIFDSNVDIISLRGSNLLKSIEKDFYKDLPVKQFHLYDGDRAEYKTFIEDKVNTNPKWKGFTTNRKEIEYYIPIPLINIALGIDIDDCAQRYNDENFDLINHILNQNATCQPFIGIKCDNKPEIALKNFLNKTAIKNITKEDLVIFGVYDEIKMWFEQMKALSDLVVNN